MRELLPFVAMEDSGWPPPSLFSPERKFQQRLRQVRRPANDEIKFVISMLLFLIGLADPLSLKHLEL